MAATMCAAVRVRKLAFESTMLVASIGIRKGWRRYFLARLQQSVIGPIQCCEKSRGTLAASFGVVAAPVRAVQSKSVPS
jgi:hypothetical protein